MFHCVSSTIHNHRETNYVGTTNYSAAAHSCALFEANVEIYANYAQITRVRRDVKAISFTRE